MNPVVKDMQDSAELLHYGMPKRSGRYPYGSGDNPYQHGRDFLGRIEELKKTGWNETPENIYKEFGLNTSQYRIEKAIAKDERRMLDVARAKSLAQDGKGPTEIGREMGINESTVRSLLNDKSEARMMKAKETAAFIKKQIDERGMIDVGRGVELELNVSKEKLDQALYLLEREGYPVYNNRMEQVTNRGQWTTQKVICPPGTPYSETYKLDKVHSLKEYITRDGGETYEKKFHYPESMDSKRLMIRYNEEGGLQKDGIVELRRNVPDLSLGESRYAQVRILVDKTHYIKGMAVYSDDLPDGVDVVFNTNKKKGTPMTSVLKKIKEDPDNPFGSLIKDAEQGGQYWYNDSKTGEKKLGLINKRADEGDWTEWADALPSQFLGKQSLSLAKKQLNLAKADKLAEYDEICSLTNPTVKKYWLNKFAEECDSAAVDLKAAALPGQKYHVIIPNNTLKDTEIYAPGYENGTQLALIRYPHGGTFEIPIVTVNNKNALGKKTIGTTSIDAVGITSKVAERLSGADFDGDTVMCIPTHDKAGKVKITSTPPLKGLEGFDPKEKYGPDTYTGKNIKLMTKKGTQTQMGIISNLITDMTLAGASDSELAAAVRHSMVVIDAEKHKLNYKQSELDNNIPALHKAYQGKATGGASTILSRSKGETTVTKRQGTPKTNLKDKEWYDPSKPEGSLIYKVSDDLYYPDRYKDKKTGNVVIRTAAGKKISYDPSDKDAVDKYTPVKRKNEVTGEVTYTDKSGTIQYKTKTKTQKSTKMRETEDANTLVSKAKHPMELLYADYANSMKSLANQARIESAHSGKIKYDASAKKTYQTEVDSLNDKLKGALINATREREALRKANVEVENKKATQNMDKSDIKKASQQAITKYRTEVGSVSRKDRSIKITDREWEAIQAGAISENTLIKILNNSDADSLRERSMPRNTTQLSTAKVNKIKQMNNSNYTLEQIAKQMNLSTSTVSKYLKGAK